MSGTVCPVHLKFEKFLYSLAISRNYRAQKVNRCVDLYVAIAGLRETLVLIPMRSSSPFCKKTKDHFCTTIHSSNFI